jgi:hypothetical protein
MGSIEIKTVKGGKKREITLKKIKTRLKKCDGNSGWAAQAEIERIVAIHDEKVFRKEFDAPYALRYIYLDELRKFALQCIGSMGVLVLKDMLFKKVPSKLTGWLGYGVKVVYVSTKKRGTGIEFRYKRDGTIEVWKIEEITE